MRQTPQQAEIRQHLKELLAGRQASGIIFTTMQKFEETDEALSDRRNIIVMVDEAHRGQYGLTEKVTTRQNKNGELEVRTTIGTARIIRDNLPGQPTLDLPARPFPPKIAARERSSATILMCMI